MLQQTAPVNDSHLSFAFSTQVMSPFKELFVRVLLAGHLGVMVTFVLLHLLHNCSYVGVHMLSIFNFAAQWSCAVMLGLLVNRWHMSADAVEFIAL